MREEEEIAGSIRRDPTANENAQTQYVESSGTENWSYWRTPSSSPEDDAREDDAHEDDACGGDASETDTSEEDASEDSASEDDMPEHDTLEDTVKGGKSKEDTSRNSTSDGSASESDESGYTTDESGYTTDEYAPDDPKFWGKAFPQKRAETLRSKEPQAYEIPGLTFSTTESSGSEIDQTPAFTGNLPQIHDDSLS